MVLVINQKAINYNSGGYNRGVRGRKVAPGKSWKNKGYKVVVTSHVELYRSICEQAKVKQIQSPDENTDKRQKAGLL